MLEGVLAIVAPGQGAQRPGFLQPWLSVPQFAERLAEFAEITGLDLPQLGSSADANTIRDTAITQPLLVAAGITSSELLLGQDANWDSGVILAGHSVGEVTAAALSGVLPASTAMAFVQARGAAMAVAAAAESTGMTAILGGDPDQVATAVTASGCTIANNNGRGQQVAAGTAEQLAMLAACPPRRSRLVPLSVAGAFHTSHMVPAANQLNRFAADISAARPQCLLLSNLDGALVEDGPDYLRRLIEQVAQPVRWDRCQDTLAELGVTGLLELPPAGTLTGLAKRNLPGVDLFSLNTPDQLDEARAFVTTHTHSLERR